MASIDLNMLEDIIRHDRTEDLDVLFSTLHKKRLLQDLNKSYMTLEYSPLYWALHYRKLEMFRYLINQGMDIDECLDGSRGYSPLHYAASIGDENLVDFLLELGANMYKRTPGHKLPFMIAYEYGHGDLGRRKLLPQDINALGPEEKNKRELGGMSMLHYAAYCNKPDSLKLLINLGADPNVSAKGRTPLQIAVMNWRQENIDILYPLTDVRHMEWQYGDLLEAFHRCVYHPNMNLNIPEKTKIILGERPLLSHLLWAGADPNGMDLLKETPLNAACNWQNPEHIEILVENGADPNMQCRVCNYMVNPLISTITQPDFGKMLESLQTLLHANPDIPRQSSIKVSSKCWRGQPIVSGYAHFTFMQAAVMKRNGHIITLGVEAGCNLYGVKDFITGSVNHLSTISPPLPQHITDKIDDFNRNPRSLQYHAKFAIRRCLGHQNVIAKINSLPLPQDIKCIIKYIGMEL